MRVDENVSCGYWLAAIISLTAASTIFFPLFLFLDPRVFRRHASRIHRQRQLENSPGRFGIVIHLSGVLFEKQKVLLARHQAGLCNLQGECALSGRANLIACSFLRHQFLQLGSDVSNSVWFVELRQPSRYRQEAPPRTDHALTYTFRR